MSKYKKSKFKLFLRLYERIEKRAENKRKFARHASQTGKADARYIFNQKSGLARATREAREGGGGNQREKGRGFFSLSVYSSFCDVFEAGKRERIWEKYGKSWENCNKKAAQNFLSGFCRGFYIGKLSQSHQVVGI